MFLDDAQQCTESWKLRHSLIARAMLGVWRWKGMQRHMERILGIIDGRTVIDFGGADGPLSPYASVVDIQGGEYKTLDEVPYRPDVIFTSHTLEHIRDIHGMIEQFAEKMEVGGYLICHVPAWTCERWRPSQYKSGTQTPHLHCFCLMVENERPQGVAIDYLIVRRFVIELAEHCGDNSIMVIGRKRG